MKYGRHDMLSVCAGCGMVGMLTAYAFVWIAQYYTGRLQICPTATGMHP